MFCVKETVNNELIVKNSRFICIIYNINSKDDVNTYLEKAKKEYGKATHYTYAYILNDSKKAVDDNEPTGTAGTPILNVLEKNDLMNTLCIVIRYFGGIKLGAGGLIRAYGKAVRNTLEKTELLKLKEAYIIELNIKYNELKELNYILKNPKIIEKNFDIDINLKIVIEKKDLAILDKSQFNYKILEETYIKEN